MTKYSRSNPLPHGRVLISDDERSGDAMDSTSLGGAFSFSTIMYYINVCLIAAVEQPRTGDSLESTSLTAAFFKLIFYTLRIIFYCSHRSMYHIMHVCISTAAAEPLC